MRDQTLPAYPRGVLVMSSIFLLMMIGFMMIFALLVLYLTTELGMSTKQAYALNAAYNALIFAIPVLGGYLGSKCFGYRFAIIVSSILSIAGLLCLGVQNTNMMYLGLSLFVMGTGICVPCLYVLLGRLYHKDDPRRDSGFTISYIGMNVGAFIASFSSGFIQQKLGFQFAFLLCAGTSAAMLVLFFVTQHLFTKKANLATTSAHNPATKPPSMLHKLVGIGVALGMIPAVYFLLCHATIANFIMISVGILSAMLIIGLAMREDKQTRNKMFAYLGLTFISIAFWALYMLSPGVMVIFAQHNLDRNILGFTIPPSEITSLDPFFIVVLGPILSMLWLWLNKKKINVSTAVKFSAGVTLMGIGYLIMALGIHFANIFGFTAFAWVVLSYFFQTSGELFLSPVGYAMVGSLSPARYEGLMMGIWQLAVGVAGALSGFLARMTTSSTNQTDPILTNHLYSHAFLMYGACAVGVGLIAFLLSPQIQKISGHQKKVEALSGALSP